MSPPHKQTLREVLATNVRGERIQREWSQEVLADKADISQRQVSQIESGIPATSVDTIEKIARAFKVEESALLKRR